MLGLLVLAACVVLPILWAVSSTFRYQVKMGLFYVCIGVSCVLSIFPSLSNPFNVDNFEYVKKIFLWITSPFKITWELQGASHYLQSSEPMVVLCNHQSSLDLIGMMYAWPKRTSCMTKASLKWAGPFGFSASLCNAVFIDRFNAKAARSTTDKVTETLINDQIKLWVFPEGTRNHDGGMLPFKKGAFHIAVNAQIPILPVVFSHYYFYSKNDKKFDSGGSVIIEVLEPIPTAGLTSDDVTRLSIEAREQMLAVHQRLNGEVERRFVSGKQSQPTEGKKAQ